MWRIRLFIRCVRRKRAKRLVVQFLNDFGLQRLGFMVSKFRHNVIRLQRYWSAHARCTRAQLLLLQLKWDQLEAGLLERLQNKRLEATMAAMAKSRMTQLDVASSRLPDLAKRVNNTTAQAYELTQVLHAAVQLMKRRQEQYNDMLSQSKKRATYTCSECSVVPASMRHELLWKYLHNRRKLHVIGQRPSSTTTTTTTTQARGVELARAWLCDPPAAVSRPPTAEPRVRARRHFLLLTGPEFSGFSDLVESTVDASLRGLKVCPEEQA
jgi:hypothetical protein